MTLAKAVECRNELLIVPSQCPFPRYVTLDKSFNLPSVRRRDMIYLLTSLWACCEYPMSKGWEIIFPNERYDDNSSTINNYFYQ